MSGNDLLSRRRKALAPAYELFYEEPVHLVRGEGVWLFDADGRRYLDCYNNVPSVYLILSFRSGCLRTF